MCVCVRAVYVSFKLSFFLARVFWLSFSRTHIVFHARFLPRAARALFSPRFLSHSRTSPLACTQARARPFSLSFPLSLPLTLALSLSLSRSLSLTLCLSHALSLSRSVSLTLCLSRALSLACSLSLARSLSFSFSLFLPRTQTHARTHSLTHALCTACSSYVV